MSKPDQKCATGVDLNAPRVFSVRPSEMTLLASRTFSIEEIARAYSVVPFDPSTLERGEA